MVVGDDRIRADRQKVSLSELNAVAVEDRRKQRVDVPVQPFPHQLACRRIRSLESAERLGQMLDNGRRLEVDSTVVDQHRDLTPARERQKFRRLVHPPLEADITERKWRARQAQHQRHLVGRQRMRTSVEREALHRSALNRNFRALDSIFSGPSAHRCSRRERPTSRWQHAFDTVSLPPDRPVFHCPAARTKKESFGGPPMSAPRSRIILSRRTLLRAEAWPAFSPPAAPRPWRRRRRRNWC